MSSSSAEFTSLFSTSVATLQYREMGGRLFNAAEAIDERQEREKPRAEVEMSQADFAARIRQERADAAREAEQKLRQEYEQKLNGVRGEIAASIRSFAEQRDGYFSRVESEVVQLSLSIARRILHRESQVEPMLVAALVRIAVEKMREDSSVTVRVAAGRSAAWKQYCAGVASLARVNIVEDNQLGDRDCVLETELGTASFGLDAQMKEVEQGLFDLLALRPGVR